MILDRFRRRRDERVTSDVGKVLDVMVRFPRYGFTGLALMRATKLRSGPLYTALMRLESQGYITSEWSVSDTPRRRLYRLACEFGGRDCRTQGRHTPGCDSWIAGKRAGSDV